MVSFILSRLDLIFLSHLNIGRPQIASSSSSSIITLAYPFRSLGTMPTSDAWHNDDCGVIRCDLSDKAIGKLYTK
jgi:hypothetical protein